MARSTGARLRILCVLTLKKQTSGFQKVFSGRLELQVYEMLGRGLNNKSIADGLGVSHKTIGTYKARLMEKLGCRTTPELMLRARQPEFQSIDPNSLTH
jgi:DNA-binding NarL/FixJ family response regulator